MNFGNKAEENPKLKNRGNFKSPCPAVPSVPLSQTAWSWDRWDSAGQCPGTARKLNKNRHRTDGTVKIEVLKIPKNEEAMRACGDVSSFLASLKKAAEKKRKVAAMTKRKRRTIVK